MTSFIQVVAFPEVAKTQRRQKLLLQLVFHYLVFLHLGSSLVHGRWILQPGGPSQNWKLGLKKYCSCKDALPNLANFRLGG